jgi:hypothetical protein
VTLRGQSKPRVRLETLTGHPGACPSQWEGFTEDGGVYYVRYRHGRLSAGFGRTIDEAVDQRLVQLLVGDEYDGIMSTGAMVEHLRPYVDWLPAATPWGDDGR